MSTIELNDLRVNVIFCLFIVLAKRTINFYNKTIYLLEHETSEASQDFFILHLSFILKHLQNALYFVQLQ